MLPKLQLQRENLKCQGPISLPPKSSKRVKRTEKIDEEVHVDCQEGQEESADQTGYRLIHIESLSNAIRNVHKCKRGHLTLREDYAKRFGLMSSLYIECSRCHKKTFLPTSNNICTGRGKSYDVNRRAVHCALQLGIGFAGLETFCSTLNLPCLAETSYHKQKETIVGNIELEILEELNDAGARLRELLKREKEDVTEDSLEDIAVSFDGTWAKRGHTSLFGGLVKNL